MATTEEESITEIEAALCSYKRHDGQPCLYHVESHEGHCVLHSVDPDKNIERFREIFGDELERQDGNKILDIEGFVFPAPFNYGVIKWAELIGINASSATFNAKADFSGATFGAEADFTGATFNAEADFSGASGATFDAKAEFREATFNAKADFSGATFNANANFWDVTFDAKAEFREATFNAKAIFWDVTFGAEAEFWSVSFGAETSFQDATFGAAVEFSGATFSAQTFFFNVTFAGAAKFGEATFGAIANFACTTFRAETNFWETTFSAKANFGYVIFASKVRFSSATVNALFDHTIFSWGASFDGADLREAEFRDMYLGGCLFARSVGLEDCRFSHVSWYMSQSPWRQYGKRWIVSDELNLFWPRKYIEVMESYEEQARAILAEPDEENQEENQQFRRVGKLQGLISSFVFPAETESVTPLRPTLTRVERVYRELKVNLEAHKNFPDAGQFHYGEMEMRRLANPPTKSVNGFLLWSYKQLSGYGESVSLALSSFLAVVLICATFYSMSGFTIDIPKRKSLRASHHAIESNMLKKSIGFSLERLSKKGYLHVTETLGQSLGFSLRTALLRRDSMSSSMSTTTSIFMSLETIFGPLTLGLLLLAVRRQLKRN